jgi:hypothetical protein
METDARVGWAAGYAAKIEAWAGGRYGVSPDGRRINTRVLSMANLFDLLQALGLQIELVEGDARRGARMTMAEGRRRALMDPHIREWQRRQLQATQAARASAGAKALNAKRGAAGRKRAARRAAKARWARKRADADATAEGADVFKPGGGQV